MKDSKKLFLVILTIFLTYLSYSFQDEIISFFKKPSDFLISDRNGATSPPNDSTKPADNVKTVIVDEEDAVVKVVEEASPAVVSVVRKEILFDPFEGPFRSEDSIGTGFIIDGSNGTILTNRHVVDSADATYSVVLGDNKEETFDVSNVYRDPVNDFAILKIDTGGKVLSQVKLGDSDKVKVGQTVVAIGNALGEFGNSVTKGVVSGLGRGIAARTSFFEPAETLEDVIQTDAALNPGNSGGPLLNLSGEVIGINVAISAGAQNIGFAIPVNALKPIVETFNQKGKISRPFLGVEYRQITKELAESRSLPVGAFVRSVVKDSPAEKAGIIAGDIILKIDGIRLDEGENTLAKVVAKMEPDTEVEIVIDRNGKEQTLTATLEDLEK